MPQDPQDRRRNRRLSVQIPVILRGTDAAGRDFFDRAEIVSIDARGGRARTRFNLKVGTEVTVQLPSQEDTLRLRVVWNGEAGSYYEGMVGLEFVEAEVTWNPETLRLGWGERRF